MLIAMATTIRASVAVDRSRERRAMTAKRIAPITERRQIGELDRRDAAVVCPRRRASASSSVHRSLLVPPVRRPRTADRILRV